MLKQINIILGLSIVTGVIYSSYILSSPEPVAMEEPVVRPGYDTPMPGSEGDQWEEFNNLMGSIQDSTDQEQE